MIVKHDLDDLFIENKIILDGTKRLYLQSLKYRDYNLEYTTPYLLRLSDGCIIKDGSWSRLIKELLKHLQSNYPASEFDLFDFKVDWSNAKLFGPNKFIVNSVEIAPGLYASVNFTAVHAIWFIQDILHFYHINIGQCALIINRPPLVEPEDIKREVIKANKESFFCYITEVEKKEEKYANTLLKNIDIINRVLEKLSRPYCNIYLLDSGQSLSNYRNIILSDHSKYVAWNTKQFEVVKKTLDYYKAYFEKVQAMQKYIKDSNIEKDLHSNYPTYIETWYKKLELEPIQLLDKAQSLGEIDVFILHLVESNNFNYKKSNIVSILRGEDDKYKNDKYYGIFKSQYSINKILNRIAFLLKIEYLMTDEILHTNDIGLTKKGKEWLAEHKQ